MGVVVRICLIAAIGKNLELGKGGDLIWKVKADLMKFKSLTMGSPLLMGRKTFESLPKVLPGRDHYVLSKNAVVKAPKADTNSGAVSMFSNVEQAIAHAQQAGFERLFVVGGAAIYEQAVDMVDEMYLTRIDCTDQLADTYFPKWLASQWSLSSTEVLAEQPYRAVFEHWKRNA